MRKILTSVLSVAGLLAVVLALATSPATAAKDVVEVQAPSAADVDTAAVGTYTVSWETQGGCDPGSGTSGATGSVTLAVTQADIDDAETLTVDTGIVTETICNYTYKASFAYANGVACRVTVTEADDGDIALAITTDEDDVRACVATSTLAVTVRANGTEAAECVDANVVEDMPCGDAAGVLDGDTAAVASTQDARDLGAVKNTVFTVTATPEKGADGKVPEGCNAASEDTEINYETEDQDTALTVVDVTLAGAECSYTVTAALPVGFAAGGGEVRSVANQAKGVEPDATANVVAVDDPDTTDDGVVDVDDLLVSVAAVTVYLVQNVIGDAGGASASYKLSTPCGAPGLPGALTARTASGGISTTDAVVVVELRTGRFNVSAGLTADATEDGVRRHALDADGDACEATVAISGVPDGCSADGASSSLDSSTGSVILEIAVDCTPPVEPEAPVVEAPVVEAPVVEAPVVEAPVDDTGDMTGGDDDTGDMTGGDDDTGDMTGGDDDTGDTDDGDDDTGEDDTGPAEKQPTEEDDTGGGPKRNGTG